jgi:hypothetical protein
MVSDLTELNQPTNLNQLSQRSTSSVNAQPAQSTLNQLSQRSTSSINAQPAQSTFN